MKQRPVKLLFLINIIMFCIVSRGFAQTWNPSHSIGTINGVYNFSSGQTPSQLVEISQAGIPNTSLTYQWYSSLTPGPSAPAANFIAINGATQSSYSPGPLTQTMYYQRKTTSASLGSIYSNIIKLKVVSVNWEDVNYVREHDVITTGIISWTSVDQLPIGQKLQTTTYFDGLGRSVEKISRETATPPQGVNLWGDVVQFSEFDVLGRQPLKYLPYTTTNQSGKFKTAPLTDQPAYYSNVNTYNETSAFSSLTFDKSPLNRVTNVKEPGQAWAASAGNSAIYDMNSTGDNVQNFSVDYIQGDAPVNNGAYPANTLYKLTYTDVNNNNVVEYTNKDGQLILSKVQIDPVPSAAHIGWICTYSIYDNFGLLRYKLQPEAVRYLDANSWSFAGTNGQQVLAELCFQYNYDDKGRTIWKKAPGAFPLSMIYDIRDRVVFMQDGNQAAISPTPQWTANLYDELDRSIMTTLYNTNESISSLQTDISNSVTIVSTVNTTTASNSLNDLVVTNRNTNIATYSARNSVTLAPNFASSSGDTYVVQIDPSASTPALNLTTAFFNNPISSANLQNPAVTTILKYQFFDDYSFSSVKIFDNGFTNLSAYNTSDPNVIPLASSQRTMSMATGNMTRVLGTNIFLSSTNYYDEKGRNIQNLEDNIKSGTDVTTLQYHFDGRVLSSSVNHSAPGTSYSGFITLNKYIFDNIGRLTSIQKQFGNNSLKTVSFYDYDDIGRVKTKHLDPNYNNPNSGAPDLESLNYSFNIHNQITGINKDYALKNPANYNKWGHFFGLDLGFDKKDNVFTNVRLNGQVSGLAWNTQGDDAQRKYDYSYDNAGRLSIAAFNEQQHPGDGWSNSKMDFSVTGTNGQITYDYNGNMLTMLQKGVVPGTTAPIIIDDLRYTYNSYSNKLQSVTDQMTTTTLNGLFGDFKDGTNGSTPDYVYDNNGNLVIDLNKNVQSLNNGAPGTNGVSYNFLDKPDQIRVIGKGTIKIVYSANGQKLQRVFIPESVGASTITSYIDEFVYQETATLTLSSPAPFNGTNPSLAYINFEEGRIRLIQPIAQNNGYDALSENGNLTLPNGKMGAYDYFIMDYQKNVRMILTEETHSATNTCTMETSRSSAEDPVFGQPGASNEVETTRFAKPSGWTASNLGNSVSRLGNTAGHTLGPNMLQKVMAGDQISASVQYYYQGTITNSNPNIVIGLLSSLAQAILGGNAATSLVKGGATNITSQLGASSTFINAVQPAGSGGNTPQAFLTFLFFDERFNFIASTDGGVAQQQVASSVTSAGASLGLANIKAPKNGYVYAYVSNRSDQDVFFDNLMVGVVAGNIIEENHYYAYGLKIASISSKKLGDINEGKLSNPYLYNEKEMLDEDAGLNWYDYGFRNYDPQIGRFPQLDPLTDDYPYLTPYQYASCEPITNIDIDGLESGNAVTGAIQDFTYIYHVSTDMRAFIFPALHAATTTTSEVAKGAGSLKLVLSITSIAVQSSITTSNLINNKINTEQVGNIIKTQNNSIAKDKFWKRLFIRYAGTNYVPLLGDVKSFHNSDVNYRTLWPFGRGSIDEPAANLELGWALKGDNNGQSQIGGTWYHLKPDPVQGVKLDNGYTQVGIFVGRNQILGPIANNFQFSLNTTLAVGVMMSKPRVDDGLSGSVQGYVRDGAYSSVGMGVALGVAPTITIAKWFSIFGAYNVHVSQTKPLYIIGGSTRGPGRISTVAGSFMFGLKISSPF